MAAARQDAWTEEDDLILAEVTLRHIREGGTQLAAFEEVGKRIGRTSAACGFRWNSYVRKKYEAGIQIAKAQRQQRKKELQQQRQQKHAIGNSTALALEYPEGSLNKSENVSEETMSIEAVIRFLRQSKNAYQEMNRRLKQLEKELAEKQEEIERLRKENEQLSKEVNEVQVDYKTMSEDYKALIQIMERARKMAVLAEGEEEPKPKFKMDANGNLERIE